MSIRTEFKDQLKLLDTLLEPARGSTLDMGLRKLNSLIDTLFEENQARLYKYVVSTPNGEVVMFSESENIQFNLSMSNFR